MSNKIMWSAFAKVSGDGVEMETDLAGTVTREFIDAKSGVQDKAIRQWLINQGWTPPEINSAAPDMYRALRAAIHACDDEQDYQAYKMAVAALAKADGEV